MTDDLDQGPPIECERCEMDLLPLQDYGPGRWDPGSTEHRWLCEVCANTCSEPRPIDLNALVHLLYAKLLDIEKQLGEVKAELGLTNRKE